MSTQHWAASGSLALGHARRRLMRRGPEAAPGTGPGSLMPDRAGGAAPAVSPPAAHARRCGRRALRGRRACSGDASLRRPRGHAGRDLRLPRAGVARIPGGRAKHTGRGRRASAATRSSSASRRTPWPHACGWVATCGLQKAGSLTRCETPEHCDRVQRLLLRSGALALATCSSAFAAASMIASLSPEHSAFASTSLRPIPTKAAPALR